MKQVFLCNAIAWEIFDWSQLSGPFCREVILQELCLLFCLHLLIGRLTSSVWTSRQDLGANPANHLNNSLALSFIATKLTS